MNPINGLIAFTKIYKQVKLNKSYQAEVLTMG
jgi:hypothetical protein